ncbi:mechanosensitive ion channel domain-containing protein [Natronomonas marina]|jgi:small-conductance mechanosensitive channel|uniref:mechanosensitive ion channel domain-containing protein n=1 Tax=Natronomonas marina TaxID=2961939 RepID=UPI0020CA02BB|nr:mechanosensitive ion channel domain-containing protein [Natronomonas marina]
MQVIREWFDGLAAGEQNFVVAVALVVVGLILGGVTAWLIRRVLLAFDVNEVVEGTAFERTARSLGTSTVGLLSQLFGFFVFLIAALYAFETLEFVPSEQVVRGISEFLPQLFVAVLVVIVGVLLGDKAEIVVGERLRSIKLPEVTVIPRLVKYSILYVATLIALSQLGVATGALLILLAAYAFGLFFLGGLAFKDLLSSAAGGIYLLLTEPYSIGDEVEIDGKRGIVQEMDVFVTHVESDGEEYVIPNRIVLRDGAMRVRN